ncbi:MAG: glycosyltransferase family 39 protein [Kiritimatiellae bacterium]|nr:glycosyltransferase family 39 protein [Kiritimatiellia bacterium]MCO5068210.1 glycosyltransferase family 39 protein [Kiritimatiellia bacterium]
MTVFERIAIGCLLAASFVFGAFHLSGPLDEPMWRQTDTAYMAVRMMDESPPDILRPKAPYRGTNDVKAAEFPIYPALVSLGYKAVGHESLPVARAISLTIFWLGLFLLWESIKILSGARIASWSVVVYAWAPLSLGYARMVHPDFTIVLFSHLFLFALLRFVVSGRVGWWLLACLGATGAFLMKAPYCFYLGLLPGWWWLVDREKRTWGRFAGLATVFIIPLIAGLWFNSYRIAQEAPFVESLIYPMKWTAASTSGRFFGHLAQRFDPMAWKLIAQRLWFLVLTPIGVILALAGLWRLPAEPRSWVVWIWGIGVGLYTLLVFPMVTSGHEYYSIPFLAYAGFLAARGGIRIVGWAQSRLAWRPAVAGALILLLWGIGVQRGLARGPYLSGDPWFSVDWQRVLTGRAIAEHTAKTDLVLSVTHGRSTGWSDPRILYNADRLGWAIEARSLTASNLESFAEAGASIAAVLVTPEAESREDELGPLAHREHETVKLERDGMAIGSVRFYRLDETSPMPRGEK